MSALVIAFFSVLAAQLSCFAYASLVGQVHTFRDIAIHLLLPSGAPLTGAYIAAYWSFGAMPGSYYDEEVFRLRYVLYQLVCVDALMTLAHVAIHQKLLGSTFYSFSHAPHHTHTPPRMTDAFDGSVVDTTTLIIAPLFAMSRLVHATTYEYMVFGVVWSTLLTLIHSPSDHVWETTLLWKGCLLATASDHRRHHKHPSQNQGHIFKLWDIVLRQITRARVSL